MLKKRLTKKISYYAGAVILSLCLGFCLQIAFAWNPPTLTPPNGNIDEMISAGADAQTKTGDLTINGVFSTDNDAYLSTLSGNVGIGTTTPQEKLTLDGGNFLHTSKDPIHIGSIFDSDAGCADCALSSPTSIYVSGKYAYVASFNDSGIEILDISDPANPTHAGSIFDSACDAANGGECFLSAPVDIYVSGKYAYIANLGPDNGIEILDISNPSGPTHIGSINDSVCDSIYGGECALWVPKLIYVSGKYAYIASGNMAGTYGLEILDISDPANPTHAGSIFDSACDYDNSYRCALWNISGIYISGEYAYLLGQSDGGLEILDISDPANPTHAGSIFDSDAGCADCALSSPTSIYVSGKYAYTTSASESGMEIINISDPANPTHVGSIFDSECDVANSGRCALAQPYSINISGKYAYVYDFQGIEILDISDPANPTHAGSIFDSACDDDNSNRCALRSTWGVFGSYIKISGKYAYITGSGDGGVEILDISGIDSPSASIGNISSSNITVTDSMEIGNNLYVRNGINAGTSVKSDGPVQGSYLETLGMLQLNATSTIVTCDANSEGEIYYDDSLNEHCFCNGNDWKKITDEGNCVPEYKDDITDVNFQGCIATAVGKTWDEITNSDLTNLGGTLNCSSKSISNIDGVQHLTSLAILWVSSNQLTSLPAEIGNLTNLSELYLYDNQLTSLPAEIGNLTSLESLELQYNQLTSLPAEIGNLTSLIQLSLDNNQLTSLPAEIGGLTNLSILISTNNQLTSLPVEIGGLTNLTKLYLYYNQLTSLPAEIGSLTGLTLLHLSNNQLTSLPAEIGSLTGLTLLYLDNNLLASLPAEIGGLTNLNGLFLHYNQLTSLPAEIGGLTSLYNLYLHQNQLTSLPAEIGNLTSLGSLWLHYNQLTSIPSAQAGMNLNMLYVFVNNGLTCSHPNVPSWYATTCEDWL